MKKIIAVFASAVLVAGAFFAGKLNGSNETAVTADLYALDTFCTISIYSGGGEAELEIAEKLLQKFDALFDTEEEGSDLYRINHRETDRVRIDEETAALLTQSKKLEEETGGSLLIGIRPLTELWDVKNRSTVPEQKEIDKALLQSETADWSIENASDSWYFCAGNRETRLEIGAVAKGYIADRIAEELKKCGVTSALIDLGGNVQTIGGYKDGKFRIGIKDPAGEKEYLDLLEISDASVVTAGSYERYFEVNGVRYHHILDPENGWPVTNGLASVTVTGSSSFLCDGLATACFVKGYGEAEKMLSERNSVNTDQYRAVYVFDDGSVKKTEAE